MVLFMGIHHHYTILSSSTIDAANAMEFNSDRSRPMAFCELSATYALGIASKDLRTIDACRLDLVKFVWWSVERGLNIGDLLDRAIEAWCASLADHHFMAKLDELAAEAA